MTLENPALKEPSRATVKMARTTTRTVSLIVPTPAVPHPPCATSVRAAPQALVELLAPQALVELAAPRALVELVVSQVRVELAAPRALVELVVSQVGVVRLAVVELTSPPHYPPFNGKKERSMRDIKSYERALRKHKKGASLFERIDITLRDLNEDRPRPVLGGRTAREVFEDDRAALPSRKRFKMDVATRQVELEAKAGSRKEVQAARRRAVIEILSRYKLLNWRGDMSTNLQRQVGTF